MLLWTGPILYSAEEILEIVAKICSIQRDFLSISSIYFLIFVFKLRWGFCFFFFKWKFLILLTEKHMQNQTKLIIQRMDEFLEIKMKIEKIEQNNVEFWRRGSFAQTVVKSWCFSIVWFADVILTGGREGGRKLHLAGK